MQTYMYIYIRRRRYIFSYFGLAESMPMVGKMFSIQNLIRKSTKLLSSRKLYLVKRGITLRKNNFLKVIFLEVKTLKKKSISFSLDLWQPRSWMHYWTQLVIDKIRWYCLFEASNFKQFGLHVSTIPDSMEDREKLITFSSSYTTNVRWHLNPANEMAIANINFAFSKKVYSSTSNMEMCIILLKISVWMAI